MKTVYSFIRRSAVAAMSIAALCLTACEDEPDKYEIADGNPTVHYVCSPADNALLTSALSNSRVCIVGDNMRSVTRVFFNDQEAVLNSSLITDHTLITSIPKALPVKTDNKIYLYNQDGQVTEFDFVVSLPSPELNAMLCEQVKPGETATILGDYLLSYADAPLKVKMPDGTEITDFTEIDINKVSFKVPAGCTKSGPITVTSKYGSTKSSKFFFNDQRGILFDFDGLTGLGNHGWHNRDILSDETSLAGNFVQLGDGATELDATGAWNDSQFSFEYWCGSWDTPQNFTSGDGIALTNLVDFTDWQKMALKFEMYIPSSNPWSSGAMQLIFAGTDLVTLAGPCSFEDHISKSGSHNPDDPNDLPGANNKFFNTVADGGVDLDRALYRPWEATGSFDTGDKWITVTVPFTDFKYNFVGAAGAVHLDASSFASFTMFVVSGGVDGKPCMPIIKVDNIRAVPYK